MENEEGPRGSFADSWRSMYIDDAHEAAFEKVNDDYAAMKGDGSTPDHNCTNYAAEAWKAATGENLPINNGPI